MKKIKNQKKVYAFALVVLMLATIFAVSASAETVFNDPLCECFAQGSFIELGDKVGELTYNATGECSVCHTSYEFVLAEVYDTYPYYEIYNSSCDEQGNLYFLEALWCHENKETVGDCSDLLVSSVSVIDAVGDKGMVGDMANAVSDTIGGLLKGVGHTVISFFDKVVLAADGGLSTLATWTLVLLGVSFGLGAIGWIIGKVRR